MKFNSTSFEFAKTDSAHSFHSPKVGHTVKGFPRIRRMHVSPVGNVMSDPVNRTSEIAKNTMNFEHKAAILKTKLTKRNSAQDKPANDKVIPLETKIPEHRKAAQRGIE